MSLPSLTSIANAAGLETIIVEALAAGDVELPLVTQITGAVELETNSAGSTLDLSDLTTFTGGILAYSGGTLSASGSSQQLPALTNASSTSFQISGGVSLSLPAITSAVAADFVVSGGSSLTLAGVTAFTGSHSVTTLEATGAGSVLSLPSLTSIANAAGLETTFVEALAAGDVELPLVTQITGAVELETNSAGSTLDLSDLTTFTGGILAYSGGTLNASGSTQQLPALTNANSTSFQISGGVSLSLPAITSAVAADFVVSGGSSLTLTGVTAYTGSHSITTLEATGAGSVLSLPSLTSIAKTAASKRSLSKRLAAGDVELPLVTQITGPRSSW